MKTLKLLFLAFCLIVGLEHSLVNSFDEPCTTFEHKPGRIIEVNDCAYIAEIVVKVMERQLLTAREHNILKYSGRNNFAMAVCCEDLINTSGLELLKENEQSCGKFRVDNIVGGEEIRMGSRPWMALLEYNNTKSRFQCGATLITPRYLLTAAHCVQPDLISARLGEHNISTEEDCKSYFRGVHCLPYPQDIAVEKTIVHKDFNWGNFVHDIALIRLKTPANITNYVQTICLPLYENVQQSIRKRSSQKVTGWGITPEHKISDSPFEAEISRLPLTECHRNRTNPLLENQLCFSAFLADSCSGDSGGPLSFPYTYKGAQRFVQMGIVSYGPANCGLGETAVYTDVISFLPWITQNIKP